MIYYLILIPFSSALNSQLERSNKKLSERMEDRSTGKQRKVSKRKTVSNSVSDQAGPSSQSTNYQRTTDKNVERGEKFGQTGQQIN